MFGNSYLKWVIIIFSLGAVASAIYTAIFNASPIVTIVLFLVALMLNIVDGILTKKDYEKFILTCLWRGGPAQQLHAE